MNTQLLSGLIVVEALADCTEQGSIETFSFTLKEIFYMTLALVTWVFSITGIVIDRRWVSAIGQLLAIPVVAMIIVDLFFH